MKHDTLDPFAPDLDGTMPRTTPRQSSATPLEPYGEDASYDSAPTGTGSDFVSRTKNKAESIVNKARGFVSRAEAQVGPRAKQVMPSLREAKDFVAREVKEHPMRTAVVALGLGWVMGRGMPKVLALAGIYGLSRIAK